jgi:hypothetical protein
LTLSLTALTARSDLTIDPSRTRRGTFVADVEVNVHGGVHVQVQVNVNVI